MAANLHYTNSKIVQEIIAAGQKPNHKFSREIGLSYLTLSGFIRDKESPINSNGTLRGPAKTLCDYLGVLPEDLWDREELFPNDEEEFIEQFRMHGMLDYEDTNPETILMLKQQKAAINKSMKRLGDREEFVLRMRTGVSKDGEDSQEELSIDDVALIMEISRSRVSQIEWKAYKKMRNPCLSDRLRNTSVHVLATNFI